MFIKSSNHHFICLINDNLWKFMNCKLAHLNILINNELISISSQSILNQCLIIDVQMQPFGKIGWKFINVSKIISEDDIINKFRDCKFNQV